LAYLREVISKRETSSCFEAYTLKRVYYREVWRVHARYGWILLGDEERWPCVVKGKSYDFPTTPSF